MKNKTVLCAGIIVMDHGCSPIDHFPLEGELIATTGMALTLGGCAANVGVNLSKLDINAEILGKIGDDDFGEIILRKLKKTGTNINKIIKQKNSHTSQTLIINIKGQDRRFIHMIGANEDFTDNDLQKKDIEGCRIIYLGGYLLMNKLTPDHVANIFQMAQKNGSKTVLDVVTPGFGNHLEKLTPILPYVDVFLPNDTEAKLISGIENPVKQAEFFKSLGVKTSIITMGNQGTIMLNNQGCYRAGIFNIDYHDGSGSGDAFTAGFISGLLDNKSEIECIEIGSALGASCVRTQGTTEGVFNKKECAQFLNTNKLVIKKLD